MKKTSVIVVSVVGVFLVGILITIENRLRGMEERLERAEASLETLEPLRRIFAGYKPTPAPETGPPYQPVQATGEPDVDPRGRDSALAWCPATEDGGEEWLLLDYVEPVEVSAVTIRAGWNPGAATRVLAVEDDDTERELWSGPAIGNAAGWEHEIKFAQVTTVNRLKVVFDTAAVPGWNEIDAVGLLGTDGETHWAAKATASSSWSRNQPEPAAERTE